MPYIGLGLMLDTRTNIRVLTTEEEEVSFPFFFISFFLSFFP